MHSVLGLIDAASRRSTEIAAECEEGGEQAPFAAPRRLRSRQERLQTEKMPIWTYRPAADKARNL